MVADMQWVQIERTFDSSIEVVWQMWTDPDLFKQWYGPNGMTVTYVEIHLEVGGKRKVCMQMESSENSMAMWFIGEFKEVNPPTRLVYTESMCDEDENILSAESMGMPSDHPDTTEVIIELSEKGSGTALKLTHVGVPADSGGAGGWSQALEKLAALAAAS